MKGRDPKKMLTKKELQDPEKVQNLAPERAKHKCPTCGQQVPGEVHPEEQKSGKKPAKSKMRHGAY